MTSKPLDTKRSFLEPLHVSPISSPSKGAKKASGGTLKLTSPTSSREWLQLASHLLITGGGNEKVEKRVLTLCEDVASMLLEEDAKSRTGSQKKTPPVPKAEKKVLTSPRGSKSNEHDSKASSKGIHATGAGPVVENEEQPPSTERLQAAYLLTAAAVTAVDVNCDPAADLALRLARASVEAFRCPMTAYTMAMTCVRWGVTSRDVSRRSAAYQTASTVITSTCAALLDKDTLSSEEMGYLLRMAWLLVRIGAPSEAREPVTVVLQHNSQSYMGLLLLTLLHAAEDDYDSANKAVMHLIGAYPDDVVGIVVHAAVRLMCRPPEAKDARGKEVAATIQEEVSEELAVAMARIFKLSAEAVEAAGVKKKSLKGLCTHCAPDEEVEGGPKYCYGELKRRIVGHWALLSHVATRLGCLTVANVATEAGTDAIAGNQMLYSQSFADLQSSKARLSLMDLKENVASQVKSHWEGSTAPLVRDLNLLSMLDFHNTTPMYSSHEITDFPLVTKCSGGATIHYSLHPGSEAPHLLPQRRFDSIAATLMAALEAWPNHVEGHTLLGATRVLEASQPELPSDTRRNRLQEAGWNFMNAIRADTAYPEAYIGAGVVAEAQGATGESFDYFTSAAEVSARASFIPWSYFDYLYQ